MENLTKKMTIKNGHHQADYFLPKNEKILTIQIEIFIDSKTPQDCGILKMIGTPSVLMKWLGKNGQRTFNSLSFQLAALKISVYCWSHNLVVA